MTQKNSITLTEVKLVKYMAAQSNDIKIRNKCDWYEFSDKSNKFFLILEKR